MENRGSKVLTIVALCIAVAGLTLGFAAFSTTLNISAGAEVTPNSDTFKLQFSTNTDDVVTTGLTGVVTGTATLAGAAPTIENEYTAQDEVQPRISGLSATFVAPGDKVVYTFYVLNTGSYNASLTGIDLGAGRSCTNGGTVTEGLLNAACQSVNLTVQVGDAKIATNGNTLAGVEGAALSGTNAIAKGDYTTVVVTIEYTGTAVADGDFSVAFDDVKLNYTSVA